MGKKYRERHSNWCEDGSDEWNNYYYIQQFMLQVINTFKEAVIDVNDIKEVKRINE